MEFCCFGKEAEGCSRNKKAPVETGPGADDTLIATLTCSRSQGTPPLMSSLYPINL